jgi:hypothetical protein
MLPLTARSPHSMPIDQLEIECAAVGREGNARIVVNEGLRMRLICWLPPSGPAGSLRCVRPRPARELDLSRGELQCDSHKVRQDAPHPRAGECVHESNGAEREQHARKVSCEPIFTEEKRRGNDGILNDQPRVVVPTPRQGRQTRFENRAGTGNKDEIPLTMRNGIPEEAGEMSRSRRRSIGVPR